MGVRLVDIAFSGPTLLSFFGGQNSGTASMATSVSTEGATSRVRGSVGLCSCAASVITLGIRPLLTFLFIVHISAIEQAYSQVCL